MDYLKQISNLIIITIVFALMNYDSGAIFIIGFVLFMAGLILFFDD